MVRTESEYVCHDCVGDSYLSQSILEAGDSHSCDYCGQTEPCISITALADLFHEVFQAQFSRTPEEPTSEELVTLGMRDLDYCDWERAGEPVPALIEDILGVSADLASSIHECLSERYDSASEKQRFTEEQPYAESALYEENGFDTWELQESWRTFKDEIARRTRFFNARAETILGTIFKDLTLLRTHRGENVILAVSAEDDFPIWRGPVADEDEDVCKLLQQPIQELGPPPSHRAKPGRMNPQGIAVFYGAENRATCIAEIRPSVGSQVVLAQFTLLRTVSLLDLDRLKEVYEHVSRFDPSYDPKHSRRLFLRQLVEEISRPILPRAEERDYLPTQVVAEYLAQRIHPRLDGIIFRSSQTDGANRNIVLFNHASVIDSAAIPPGVTFDVDFGSPIPEDDDEAITVWERRPIEADDPKSSSLDQPDPKPFKLAALFAFRPETRIKDDEESLDKCWEPTLQLDRRSITVVRITAVDHKHRERRVSQHGGV